jgi:hypothetical protein
MMISGTSTAIRQNSGKTGRHRRRKPYISAAILSGKINRECKALLCVLFYFVGNTAGSDIDEISRF